MKEKRKQTLFLSAIGIIVLLTLIVGSTFAFFSTKLENGKVDQTVTTAKLGEVTFTTTDFNFNEVDILPGKEITGRKFSVSTKSVTKDVSIKYDCELVGDLSGLTDIEYRLSTANAKTNDGVWKPVPDVSTSIFSPSVPMLTNAKPSDTYLFDVRYRETGDVQDTDQGKQINIGLSCKLADGDIIYYNEEHKGGTSVNLSKYTVKVTTHNGDITPKEQNDVPHDTFVKFDLIPSVGYEYSSNDCGGEVIGNEMTINNIQKNITCNVIFTKKKYDVKVNAVANGLIDNKPSITKQVEHATNGEFTLKPDTGYIYLSNDCGAAVLNNTLTISNVTEPKTCNVEFTKKEYEVKVNAGPNGQVESSPLSTKTVLHGDTLTFALNPSVGYSYVSNNCGGTVKDNILTIPNVTGSKECTVNFDHSKYNVTAVSTNTNFGTVSPDTQTVFYNNTATIKLAPKTGYHYSGNDCDASLVGNELKVNNVTSDKACKVSFALNSYNINASSNNNDMGTVTVNTPSVSHGSTATITLAPSAGYHYVSNDCGATHSGNTLTINNVTSAKTCNVVFAINEYDVVVNTNSTSYGTVSPANQKANHGSTKTVNLSPATGYHPASVSGCTGASISGNTLTISNITESKSCTVNFAINTYTVKLTAVNGTVNGAASQSKTVNYNSAASFTNVKPNSGYTFKSITCGSYSGTTVTIPNVISAKNCTIEFIPSIKLKDKIMQDNPTVGIRSSFGLNTTTTTNTIYVEKRNGYTQDNKPVYYFSGKVENNYVKFGKHANGNDMFWRIVRINEDGSVRLIYAGKSWDDEYGMITSFKEYNPDVDRASSVGYMYTPGEQHGLSTNSAVKITVDNWYKDNLLTDYDKYISKTAIYCNDRDASGWHDTGGDFDYDGRTRTKQAQPTFKCKTQADQFTVRNSKRIGNEALQYPVALPTTDEIMYAGEKYSYGNLDIYIAQNARHQTWWTMTASEWSGNRVQVITASPCLNGEFVNGLHTYGVRPTLSLKSCVLTNGGNGTSTNPYTITIDGECEKLEN